MSVLTDEQLLGDVAAGMSGHAIAKKYSMSPGNINRRIKRLGARGLGHGGNVSRFVPDGYKVKGTSSLVKPDGSVSAAMGQNRCGRRAPAENDAGSDCGAYRGYKVG